MRSSEFLFVTAGLQNPAIYYSRQFENNKDLQYEHGNEPSGSAKGWELLV
jgi:hypothetical protein